VVPCLSIPQCTPVLEQEPWFVSQAWPCGRTILKSGLRWSVTWWRRAAFYHRIYVDRWVLAEGIDRCPIATPYHADFLGFVAWISVRANPDDRVIINEVLIGSHARPSIGFVIAGCLTIALNVVAEFLRPRWNSKSMVIMRHSYCFWAGCSRSSASSTMNDIVLNRNRKFIRNFS
jgi:hypothetical protein